jgi:hypothetical protein
MQNKIQAMEPGNAGAQNAERDPSTPAVFPPITTRYWHHSHIDAVRTITPPILPNGSNTPIRWRIGII